MMSVSIARVSGVAFKGLQESLSERIRCPLSHRKEFVIATQQPER